MMIQPLEARRLFAVDFALSGLSSNLPAKLESKNLTSTSVTVKVVLKNVGSEVVRPTTAPVAVGFYLRSSSGADTLIGTVASTRYTGLKALNQRTLQTVFRIPTTVSIKADTYTLVAKITGESAIPGSSADNNTATGKPLNVIASGTTLFSKYGFGDVLKFTKTKTTTVSGKITESGTFTDQNLVKGTYLYTINGPDGGQYKYNLTLTRDGAATGQVYSLTYTTISRSPVTIGGRTGSFSATPNGGVKATGSPNSSGSTVYYRTN